MAFPVYFDEDSMRASVLRALREFSWDCLSVIEAHNEALSDEHQLTWATNHGRCVFTSNQRDFARLHREWARAGREHGGIIILTNERCHRRLWERWNRSAWHSARTPFGTSASSSTTGALKATSLTVGYGSGVNRIGRCLIPPMKLERSRSGWPASSTSGKRRNISS